MNPNTGRLYFTESEQLAAKERGEPLIEIGPEAASVVNAGLIVREKIGEMEWSRMSFGERTREVEKFERKGRRGRGKNSRKRRMGLR